METNPSNKRMGRLRLILTYMRRMCLSIYSRWRARRLQRSMTRHLRNSKAHLKMEYKQAKASRNFQKGSMIYTHSRPKSESKPSSAQKSQRQITMDPTKPQKLQIWRLTRSGWQPVMDTHGQIIEKPMDKK